MHKNIEVYFKKGKGYWCNKCNVHMIINMDDDQLINTFEHIVKDLFVYRNDEDLSENRNEIKLEIIKRKLEDKTREKLGKYRIRYDQT